jgi:putative flippase GtrA
MPANSMNNRASGSWSTSVAKFAVTGATGFVMDAAVLSLLVATTDLGPYLARGISFPVALCITWYLNRTWTFERTDQHGLFQSVRYVLVQTFGTAVNFSVYALCIAMATPAMARLPVVALAIASAVAMTVNFFGSRYWAFAGPREEKQDARPG